MKTSVLFMLVLCGVLFLPGYAVADPWKDESGHGYKDEPPPWAPAHGYRRKHEGPRDYRYREEKPVAEIRVSNAGIAIRGSTCDREAAGAVFGGILGGIIGNQVGRNEGNQELGTVAGAIIGFAVGKSLGRGMDSKDASCTAHALDSARDGQTVSWHNPDSGVDFRLTPIETFQSDGLLCRRYHTEVIGSDDQAEGRSKACRTQDGTWRFGQKTST
ncbi:RT0821/Lpp0805 family surface protein [Thiohalomonas denitrificans]|uniref:RT0821/Lpp0805 family surface protein n=1 Tax=Thiohalomonas denitrificans TaxID=415747 RepID=UPI0026EA8E3B|nr:RT0821/Lpp0805 family surface protein [Thiohalomonas denitrificans]